MRRLRQWAGQMLNPPAVAAPAQRCAPPLGAATGESNDLQAQMESIRETLAAVIYEAFFPTLTWGDATRSGKQTAYASADAVLHVLRPYATLPGTDAKA